MQDVRVGSVLVRRDLDYPTGALVVDGPAGGGGIFVHPLGGGLQGVVLSDELSRFDVVAEQEKVSLFTQGVFCIDGVEGEFQGWSDGSVWNGWDKPFFSMDVSVQVLKAFGCFWEYDAGKDVFIVKTDSCEDAEEFAGISLELADGGRVHAYPVGAGSWIWERVS
jgi:hypothetical protein